MRHSGNGPPLQQEESRGTILWLAGWSMPDSIFDQLRSQLPDFQHISAQYSAADSEEAILLLTEAAVRKALSPDRTASQTKTRCGPLLIGGWSLGALLALRLAAAGWADGLVLFAANARFIRSREESDRGWADIYLRQMITGLAKNGMP